MAVLQLSQVLSAQLDGTLSYTQLKAMLRYLRQKYPAYPRRRSSRSFCKPTQNNDSESKSQDFWNMDRDSDYVYGPRLPRTYYVGLGLDF